MTAFTSRGVCACVCPRTGTERAQSGLEERPTERPAVLNYLICMVPGDRHAPSYAFVLSGVLANSRLPRAPAGTTLLDHPPDAALKPDRVEVEGSPREQR